MHYLIQNVLISVFTAFLVYIFLSAYYDDDSHKDAEVLQYEQESEINLGQNQSLNQINQTQQKVKIQLLTPQDQEYYQQYLNQPRYEWHKFQSIKMNSDYKFDKLIKKYWSQKLRYYKIDLSTILWLRELHIIFDKLVEQKFEIKFNNIKLSKDNQTITLDHFELRLREPSKADQFNGEIWEKVISQRLAQPIIIQVNITEVILAKSKNKTKILNSTEVYIIQLNSQYDIVRQSLHKQVNQYLKVIQSNSTLSNPWKLQRITEIKQLLGDNKSTFEMAILQKASIYLNSSNIEWEECLVKVTSMKNEANLTARFFIGSSVEHNADLEDLVQENKTKTLNQYQQKNYTMINYPTLLKKVINHEEVKRKKS